MQDQKVSCETLTVAGAEDGSAPAMLVIDYVPESFWLSKDAELDWLDRNAFFDRKGSGKGLGTLSSNLNLGSSSFSGSQRYSVNVKPKTKALIIGLPKSQKQNYAETNHRRNCRPENIRLFPKRFEPGCEPALCLTEPGSPKVSCIGRVRSRKDRSRRGKNRKKLTEPGLVKVRSIKERRTGFWGNLRLMFWSKKDKTGGKGGTGIEQVDPVISKSSSLKKKREFNSNVSDHGPINRVEPPGLGGVKRFASGRRSDDWAEKSEPLEHGMIWRRRGKGRLGEVNVGRDWQSVGPATV